MGEAAPAARSVLEERAGTPRPGAMSPRERDTTLRDAMERWRPGPEKERFSECPHHLLPDSMAPGVGVGRGRISDFPGVVEKPGKRVFFESRSGAERGSRLGAPEETHGVFPWAPSRILQRARSTRVRGRRGRKVIPIRVARVSGPEDRGAGDGETEADVVNSRVGFTLVFVTAAETASVIPRVRTGDRLPVSERVRLGGAERGEMEEGIVPKGNEGKPASASPGKVAAVVGISASVRSATPLSTTVAGSGLPVVTDTSAISSATV